MTTTAERLYELLPAVHRLRDAESGGALRELMEVLAEQVDVLREDLDQLYDDQFIETCARWVVPYIGDLIGYRALHGVVPEVASPRAEVANTIAYRRRKGTAAMLEQLARDVTGWPARAVEYFERLTTTQYMNHVRSHAAATPSLRDRTALDWASWHNGAFDDLAHTADVRRIDARAAALRGRHNIPNVGIFLWRTAAIRLTRSPLTPDASADGRRFRFDALGADVPLYGDPRTEDDISHLATPFDVPLPLSRRWLSDHLRSYYGADASVVIERADSGGEPVPVALDDLWVCDLSDAPGGGGAWAHEPPPGAVAIDPALGRVYLGDALDGDGTLFGTFHIGEAVPIGASGRGRGDAVDAGPVVTAAGGQPLQPRLDDVAAGGTLRLTDTSRFSGAPTIRATTPADAATRVTIRAADHHRPHLAASAGIHLEMEPDTTVVIEGLLVSGGPLVLDEAADNQRRTVTLRDCTLVPGQTRTSDGRARWPSRGALFVLDPLADVTLERCIVGPIVAVEGARVTLTDCVVDASDQRAVAFCGRARSGSGPREVNIVADQEVGDGSEPGGHLLLDACTILGGIHATVLDASNSLLLAALDPGDLRVAAVVARRRQVGCVRYSWLPETSRTGRRYRCQPDPGDDAATRLATRPRFTSLRFGDPAYAQLDASTPDAIRRGADDESEMGATHLLYTPQREANLTVRMDEYLRFGLAAGHFYAT